MVPIFFCHAIVTAWSHAIQYPLRAPLTTVSGRKEKALNRILTNLNRGLCSRSPGSGALALARYLLRILTVAFALPLGIACAQTVTVAPSGYVTAAVGGTVQFTATVNGSTNQSVTWSLPGQKRNSTALGTISSTGLYTAPATAPANAVEVLATSQANSQASGMQFVYVLPAGPTLSSVTPNPLSPGSTTVTIKGSGFQQYAVVDYSYNGSPIQTATLTQTSNTITAGIYLPASASNVSFTVVNPGTSPSNAYTVPVNGGAPHYTLTVTNGSGSGSYTAGAVVSITANAPPTGQSFLNWTGSPVANANAATTTITMPSSSAAVTANYTNSNSTHVLTVNNGSGSGTYSPGAVVKIAANAPPAGEVFAGWTGATVANAASAATTITMPGAATTVTATYQVGAQVPFPVTSHPRLWVTPADVTRLQGWASPTNAVYNYLKNLNGVCVGLYQDNFFPGGSPNPTYPDPGDTQGYQGWLTEDVGFVLAFNSLIDPSPANRITYAQYARNLIMYAMNQAVLGVQANMPFRDPAFPIYNRASLTGPQWPLIVDWIYNAKDAGGNNILTASDKATIQKVFLIWAGECLTAETTGGDSPYPVGAMNNFSLLNNGTGAYRMASNNYYLAHMRLITMMGLCFDPADDPVVDVTKAPAALGNTIRSYILDGIGSWLYQVYAMMGDPQTVAADYGLAGNGKGFGLASGGLPPEGMLYGESFGYALGDLLALQTAGFNDTSISGPQVKLATAPVWDRFVTGYLSSLTPEAHIPASESYLGPTYQMAGYGDMLRLYITPDDIRPFALLTLLEQEQGLSTHAAEARWFANNVPINTLSYNVQQPWTWGVSDSILYFLMLDPAAPAASDPRPSYPLNFFDPAAGRVLAHSDWTPNASWFAYRASWESDNHQDGDAGAFEFYRKGEWLTKEMSNYDNNEVGFTTYYLNSLGLKNWCANGTPSLNWFENGEWQNGSNWILGSNAGDPTTINSFGPNYSYVSSNLTNLYNRPNNYPAGNALTDITQATRSVVWLNKDFLVIYDRATSVHNGLFKTFNMSMADSPTINGNVATELMPDGQQMFVQALLPQNAVLTSRYAAGDLNPHADLDPMQYVMTDQDPTMPTDTRFLHVVQGADAGVTMAQATYVQSTSGTVFDGALFGTNAVFFPKANGASVGTTTFLVPAVVNTFVVTGLTPGAAYGVTVTTTALGKTVTLTPGGTGSVADSAGLLMKGI